MCPVCLDIFTDPVLLLCSHSICRACLKQFWSYRGFQECPVCRKRFTGCQTPANLALRNLCESFLQKRSSLQSSSEVFCDVHGEKLKLFCLDDKHPVCLVCRDSEKHLNHTFRPADEVAPLLKVKHLCVVMILVYAVTKIFFKLKIQDLKFYSNKRLLEYILQEEKVFLLKNVIFNLMR